MRKILLILILLGMFNINLSLATFTYPSNPILSSTCIGTWQDRNGHIIKIDSHNYGRVNYELSDIKRENNKTILVLSMFGGRYFTELYFDNNNKDYFMSKTYWPKNQLDSTSEKVTYNDYVRLNSSY